MHDECADVYPISVNDLLSSPLPDKERGVGVSDIHMFFASDCSFHCGLLARFLWSAVPFILALL